MENIATLTDQDFAKHGFELYQSFKESNSDLYKKKVGDIEFILSHFKDHNRVELKRHLPDLSVQTIVSLFELRSAEDVNFLLRNSYLFQNHTA